MSGDDAVHAMQYALSLPKKEPPMKLRTAKEQNGIRIHLNDDDYQHLDAHLELYGPAFKCGAALRIGNDEHPLEGHLQVPGLGSAYFGLRTQALHDIAEVICKLAPGHVFEHTPREFSFHIHDHAIYWKLFGETMGWSSKAPKWQDGAWHPLGTYQRQKKIEVETRDVLIPLPERSYSAKATLSRIWCGFPKLPRLFDRKLTYVEINMLEGEQLPVPGKGENSWDCGEDAIFSSSGPNASVEAAVYGLVQDVLKTRMRRGGAAWQPEKPSTVHA